MDDITLKRLLFSKRLYLHGVSHSNRNTELDRFLAIHHFDNAVELFLKIIATQENIISTVRQDFVFKDLWNEVNVKLRQKTPSYTLPLKDQIFNLHETRNLAQHQGDVPSHETVIKYQGYTRDFLIKCFKDIFNIEFDKVYASILVNNQKIRDALVEAEKNIEKNNFKESMKASAKAFAYLKLKERGDFSSEKLRSFTSFGVVDEHDEIRFSHQRFEEFVRELNTKLQERARKINEFAEALEEELAILKLGVDYKAFKLFNKISPYAYFTLGSSEPHITETKEENYTKENALFCYEFVLELILKLQSLDNESNNESLQ